MVPVGILMRHRARSPVLGVAESESVHVGAPHIATQQLLARTPDCRKVGIVEDGGVPYLLLFKQGKSRRTIARAKVMQVIDMNDRHIDHQSFNPDG